MGSDKRPYSPYSSAPASSTNSSTWGTFEEAVERTNREDGYLGFVFNDDGYVGIDIDHCVKEDGFFTDEAMEVLENFNSYSEYSKSGDGVHIIIKGDLPFNGRKNNGFEIYKKSRFFVLTGNLVDRTLSHINSNDEYLDHFISTFFEDCSNSIDCNYCKWKPQWARPAQGKVSIYPFYPLVGEGDRHLSLVSFCGQWWNGGISRDDLLTLAHKVNQDYLCPALEPLEVERIVASCYKYGR